MYEILQSSAFGHAENGLQCRQQCAHYSNGNVFTVEMNPAYYLSPVNGVSRLIYFNI